MRVIDFTTIGDLFKFCDSVTERTALLDKARSGKSVFFLNDEETAYLCYDSIFGGKFVGHVHGEKECRGKALWDFAYETAVWMVDYMDMRQLLCFVNKDDKRLRLFVKQFKMPLIGAVGSELLYAVDDETILRFKEVAVCQQQ